MTEHEKFLKRLVRELKVTVDESKVVLEGHCSSYYHKQLAQHEAMKVFGGKQLVNCIVVKTPVCA